MAAVAIITATNTMGLPHPPERNWGQRLRRSAADACRQKDWHNGAQSSGGYRQYFSHIHYKSHQSGPDCL